MLSLKCFFTIFHDLDSTLRWHFNRMVARMIQRNEPDWQKHFWQNYNSLPFKILTTLVFWLGTFLNPPKSSSALLETSSFSSKCTMYFRRSFIFSTSGLYFLPCSNFALFEEVKVPVFNSADYFQKKVPLWGFGVVMVLIHTKCVQLLQNYCPVVNSIFNVRYLLFNAFVYWL